MVIIQKHIQEQESKIINNKGESELVYRKGPNMANKLKTLYELFSSVSKEQIDNAINQLTPKERQVLFERYGNDLENPKEAIEWTKEKNDYFYGTNYPK